MATPTDSIVPNPQLNLINDPLHLANSDHPGMTLTSALFNGSNFLGWSRSIQMALGAKLKLGFIDGSCRKPATTDQNLQRWIRCDYMVTCWILNSMVTEFSQGFLFAKSAYDLWCDVKERFGQSNAPLIYQIQRDLNQITQGNQNVATYYSKLKRCWDELNNLNGIPVCSCGHMEKCACGVMEKFMELEMKNKLMQFLMRLNDDYESVRNHILSMDPLPSINRAYYLVQQVETQKQVTHFVPESSAFFADTVGKRTQSNQRNIKTIKIGDKKFCTHCRSDGHTIDHCFEIIGYPDWYKGRKKKNMGTRVAAHVEVEDQGDTPLNFGVAEGSGKAGVDQHLVTAVCEQMMKIFKGKNHVGETYEMGNTSNNFAGTPFYKAIALSCFSHTYQDCEWIVDTGASNHMSPHLSLFHSIQLLPHPIPIKLPDATTKLVRYIGHIFLQPNLVLTNVLYVPDFKFNLLSVGQMLKTSNFTALFLPNKCVFQDPSNASIIAEGIWSNGLYKFKSLAKTSPVSASVDANKSSGVVFSENLALHSQLDLHILHSRIGHSSVSKLIHLDHCKQLVHKDFFCDVCSLAKHHRLPFPKHTTQVSLPFELVHVDLWGPYRTLDLSGARYFFTIVDDKTRGTWTYLLPNKTHVCSTFISFLKFVKNHFHARPKQIRSDNGTEVVKHECSAYFLKKGIIHQTSMPHTPQQNGVVERKHRHLLDLARALKIHAHLPKHFFGENVF
ncbi:uncharacterized protein LOC120258408 [Dioscorea cayenensis subsp. rotundata]|uniref:Uncharacterized protein LOC120258408 n=1 Tax=Dioscorea cayennensis subsp. rotundata TaxID=55577 RepID=A0AB40B3D0_DIOCR|nr:uncharacterized protein LOC120258408 [Dioscorea cayenensis subsp. rotundata]